MFFLSLAGMIVASIMCWITGTRRMVIAFWIIWAISFLTMPSLFRSAWPLVAVQGILALILLIRWNINDIR